MAASLTTMPFFRASSARSIVRTVACSSAGNRGAWAGSRPAFIVASARKRLTTSFMVTARSSPFSRSSPPFHLATGVSATEAACPPYWRSGGRTKKASIERIARATSDAFW